MFLANNLQPNSPHLPLDKLGKLEGLRNGKRPKQTEPSTRQVDRIVAYWKEVYEGVAKLKEAARQTRPRDGEATPSVRHMPISPPPLWGA